MDLEIALERVKTVQKKISEILEEVNGIVNEMGDFLTLASKEYRDSREGIQFRFLLRDVEWLELNLNVRYNVMEDELAPYSQVEVEDSPYLLPGIERIGYM